MKQRTMFVVSAAVVGFVSPVRRFRPCRRPREALHWSPADRKGIRMRNISLCFMGLIVFATAAPASADRTTELLSVGPDEGNANGSAQYDGASEDGGSK
jgi:hypothetical protein